MGVAEQSLNILPEPVFIVNSSDLCVFLNLALKRLVGLSDQVSSMPVQGFWGEIAVQGKTNGNATFQTVKGEKIPVRIERIELPDRMILYRVTSVGAKDEAWGGLHSQRIESLGLLAGGVAHDFNNVLTGILGHITYLKTVLPKTGQHAESLVAIEDGAKKSSLMTQQILRFSRYDPEEQAAELDLVAVIKRTMVLLRGAISPEYKIVVDLPDQDLKISATEGKIAQILINLMLNARDASKRNQTITVSVRRSLQSKKSILLSVSDEGCGMNTDVKAKMFTPFFSTKDQHGTGLGLTVVQSLVHEFGGMIDVASVVNRGTTITISFPEWQDGNLKATSEEPQKLFKGTERVLVVDDESPVRSVVEMSLKHLGYQVTSAESGDEALKIFQDQKGKFDLVILDMLMPKLSGEQVYQHLKKLKPKLPVLLMSGFVSDEVLERIKQIGSYEFIQKPFTIEELSQKVRVCLS